MKHTATTLNTNLKSLLFILFGFIVLCSIPALAALTGWRWQPGIAPAITYFLYLVSLSANALTALLLISLIVWRLKLNRQKCLLLLTIIAVVFLCSLGIKSKIKNLTEEPRPFAVWATENNISTKKQNTKALLMPKRFVTQNAFTQHGIEPWQQTYWANSSKYSFPSGHSLFAAIMALLAITLLWQQKSWAVIAAIMLWSCLVETSRLALGMHWPVDIAASCAIGATLIAIGTFAWNKWVFVSSAKTP